MTYTALPVLTQLRDEAEKRALIARRRTLTPELVFSLVRDMPYQRASSRHTSAILQEWRGTCSGKHYLLDSLLKELGYATQIVMCTHLFTQQNTRHLPETLRALVKDEPVPDVHTFIRMWTGGRWMDIDATWPSSAGQLGMPVNALFELGVDMAIACDPVEYFVLPDGVDPQSFKEDLIGVHCEGRGTQRDEFIERLSEWLAEGTAVD